MRIYKDHQFLIFDFEDGRTAKYNLNTGETIGFKGKLVKSLNSQLRGMSFSYLLNCFEDEKYAKYLRFIQWRYTCSAENMGTVLKYANKNSHLEQIFAAELDDCIEDLKHYYYSISKIPKSLIKLARQERIKITNENTKLWIEYPNECNICFDCKFNTLTDKDIVYLFFFGNGNRYISLIKDYNYNAKQLLRYIDDLFTYEGLNDINYVIRELLDYAKMMSVISNKFDKYPKYFLTTHKIAIRNYNRLKKEFSEELFVKRRKPEYECVIGEYQFIYPKSTQDIKDEAVQQNNCVASYIDRVIDGKCHILFLRKKDTPDKSLVTIEVVNNKIVQARRYFNCEISNEENEVIEEWNKKFKNRRTVA